LDYSASQLRSARPAVASATFGKERVQRMCREEDRNAKEKRAENLAAMVIRDGPCGCYLLGQRSKRPSIPKWESFGPTFLDVAASRVRKFDRRRLERGFTVGLFSPVCRTVRRSFL